MWAMSKCVLTGTILSGRNSVLMRDAENQSDSDSDSTMPKDMTMTMTSNGT